MSTPMFPVTTGMEIWLIVGGDRFELTGIETTFISQGVSAAKAHIAVGYQASINGGAASQSINYLVGTPAQIFGNFEADVIDPVSGTLLLQAGQQTLFDGVYNDAGPGNLASGQFTMWVTLVSKLAQMNTGSLQYARLMPNSYIDSTVPTDPGGHGTIAGLFTSDLVSADFLNAFKTVFIAIASNAFPTLSSNTLRQYIAIFGSAVNTPAIPIINALTGSLSGSVTGNAVIATAITFYLNTLFTSNVNYQSFFQRLVEMGQEFKFRVMEHPLGIAVVPYSPFFSTPGTVVEPSTVQVMTWANQEPNNTLGVALAYSGPAARAYGSLQAGLAGAFVRTAFASPLGVVTPLQCPTWMTTSVTPDGQPQSVALELPDIGAIVANGYAQEITYELAYMGRTMQMTCPLRMDIGLLAALQVNYPALPGVGLGTAIYGSVQAVKMIIDASARTASTVFELGYVRSQVQQDAEFGSYKHPIWDNQYLGGRFDEVPLGTT